MPTRKHIDETINAELNALAEEWSAALADQEIALSRTPQQLESACRELLELIARLARGLSADERLRLDEAVRRQAASGVTPPQAVALMQALRMPLARRIVSESDGDGIAGVLEIAAFLDEVTLRLLEAHVEALELRIASQADELLELSTPVISLWDRVLALPLIGTLDSRRADSVMSSLLTRLDESHATIAIIDVTGVSTVDTQVAHYLIKTISAARLMGATCILCGIRPQIAQTMVQLGLDLAAVQTKANMREAFRHALGLLGDDAVGLA